MKYDVVPRPDKQGECAQLTFEGQEELNLLSAVYSEENYYLRLEEGTEGPKSGYQRYIEDPYAPSPDKDGVRRKVINCTDLTATNVLLTMQRFIDRTESEIREIPETCAKFEIGFKESQRRSAAMHASCIVEQINDEVKRRLEQIDASLDAENLESMFSGIGLLLDQPNPQP